MIHFMPFDGRGVVVAGGFYGTFQGWLTGDSFEYFDVKKFF